MEEEIEKSPEEKAALKEAELQAKSVKMTTEEWGTEGTDTLESFVKDRKETWSTNNGTYAFINKDGEMFVSPYNIGQELDRLGYRPESWFVPFSNNEKLTIKENAEKWEALKKAEREQVKK